MEVSIHVGEWEGCHVFGALSSLEVHALISIERLSIINILVNGLLPHLLFDLLDSVKFGRNFLYFFNYKKIYTTHMFRMYIL